MAVVQILQSATGSITVDGGTIAFPNPVQAGSLLVMVATGLAARPSDSVNGEWSGVDLGSCVTVLGPYFLQNAAAGPTTVTIPNPYAPEPVDLMIMEIAGLSLTTPPWATQPKGFNFYPRTSGDCYESAGPDAPTASSLELLVGGPTVVAAVILAFGYSEVDTPSAGPESTLIGTFGVHHAGGAQYANVMVEYQVAYSTGDFTSTMSGATSNGAILFGLDEVPTAPTPPGPTPVPYAACTSASCASIYEETFDDNSIIGIPEIDRLDIYNVVIARINTNNAVQTTAARQFEDEQWFENPDSIATFKQQFIQQVEATGMLTERGAMARLFLLADRIFRRHAFGTPYYTVVVQLRKLRPELGDFVLLTHRLLPDLVAGTLGITNVLCEVIDRAPDYSQGRVTYKLLDTRFIQPGAPYLIAPNGTPAWTSASAAQKQSLMFVSSGSPAEYSDGSPANTIF